MNVNGAKTDSGLYRYMLPSQVVNIENGTELGPNEDGEICVKGPTVMKGEKPSDCELILIVDVPPFLSV